MIKNSKNRYFGKSVSKNPGPETRLIGEVHVYVCAQVLVIAHGLQLWLDRCRRSSPFVSKHLHSALPLCPPPSLHSTLCSQPLDAWASHPTASRIRQRTWMLPGTLLFDRLFGGLPCRQCWCCRSTCAQRGRCSLAAASELTLPCDLEPSSQPLKRHRPGSRPWIVRSDRGRPRASQLSLSLSPPWC